MSDFPEGVRYYKMMEGRVVIHFPQGKMKCKYCPFCQKDRTSGLDRFECLITHNIFDSTDINSMDKDCFLKEIKEGDTI